MRIAAAIGIVLSGLIVLFLGPTASAETVTTTLGKTFEGEIVENADDFIKIKVDGGAVYKIKKRQIDPDALANIDGVQGSDPRILGEETSYSPEDWEAWMRTNGSYLKKMEYLQRSFFNVMSASTHKINQFLKKGNTKEGLKVGESARAQIALFKKQAEEMNPPEEARAYHDKIIESFTHEMKAMNAWQLGDQHVYYQYHKRGAVSFIAAVENLARVYQHQGAPAHIIRELEHLVQRQKELLEQRYQ
ncbi:MAG TPA: hypothetical protein VLJ10_06000 [Candidatus Bathyarchaeia archaeon]|nr:hypothetical protein [Candidatus Bathyarchaeia archaeon]